MGIWDSARRMLATGVVEHLGERLALAEASSGPGGVSLRGVLVRPEDAQRLGLSQLTAGDARLTIRSVDAPTWMRRGVTVTSERGETYRVTHVADNGEMVLEVILCRMS